MLLVGAPTAPGTVTISQKNAMRIEVGWSAPADYGDGKAAGDAGRIALRGYEVSLLPSLLPLSSTLSVLMYLLLSPSLYLSLPLSLSLSLPLTQTSRDAGP
jgi:hypothetical protein